MSKRPEYLAAYLAALDHRTVLLELIGTAGDDSEATSRISDAFGLSQQASTVVLDMQLRRFTTVGRARIEDELSEYL